MTGSAAERRTRADLLFKGKHYGEAAEEYRELAAEARRRRTKRNSSCCWPIHWRRAGIVTTPRQLLHSMGAQTGDAEAERLYLLSETARVHRATRMPCSKRSIELRQVWALESVAGTGSAFGGQRLLLKRDYDHAIDQIPRTSISALPTARRPRMRTGKRRG